MPVTGRHKKPDHSGFRQSAPKNGCKKWKEWQQSDSGAQREDTDSRHRWIIFETMMIHPKSDNRANAITQNAEAAEESKPRGQVS